MFRKCRGGTRVVLLFVGDYNSIAGWNADMRMFNGALNRFRLQQKQQQQLVQYNMVRMSALSPP